MLRLPAKKSVFAVSRESVYYYRVYLQNSQEKTVKIFKKTQKFS